MRVKLASGIALLGIVMVIAACGSDSNSSTGSSTSGGSESGPIKVGSPTDVTGDYALIGNTWKAGQEAAKAYINANGGIMGRQLQIDRQDTQSDPNRASTVTNQMIQSGDYSALLPSAGGIVSGPIWQAIKRANFLGLSGAALPDLADPKVYPTGFESSFSPQELGIAAACMVPTLNFKSVAILGLNDAFSQAEVKADIEKFKELGIKVTGNEQLAFTDKSVTPQLQKLKAGNPDAILAVIYGPPVGVTFTGMKSIGWDPPFLGDLSVATFPLAGVAKPNTYPTKVYGLGTPASTRQSSGYDAQQKTAIQYLKSAGGVSDFQASLNTYSYGYDAVMLYKAGVEIAKSTDQKKVIAALTTLKANPRAVGAVNQNEPQVSPEHHGLNNGTFNLIDMKSAFENGTWAAVQPIKGC